MIVANPAPPAGSRTSTTEALFNDIRSTASAIDSGDWLGAGMGVAKVAMDIISLDGDPLGAIASSGVGFVLNAVSFLREPFDVLKGDNNAITSSAGSWGGACSGLQQTSQMYREASTTQTRSWSGRAGDGYRAASNNQANGLAALGEAGKAISKAMQQGGQLLAQVRKAVLDLISDAVQKIIQICIEALSKSWLSFGASVALGIAQSVQKAVQTGQKLMQEIKKLVDGLKQIIDTVKQIIQIVKEVKALLDQIGGRADQNERIVQPAVQASGSGVPIPQVDPGGTVASGVQAPRTQEVLPGLPPIPTVGPDQSQPQGPVSQNGWPVNPPRGARTIPGTNVRVVVAHGPAGDVLMYVLGQVQSRVEDITLNSARGEHDDWGYAERNVRGSGEISNHASATAVDINATRHVLGERGTFTAAQTAEIRAILAEVDNVVRWGGDYRGRADEMHFEIVGSIAEVTAVADRLRAAGAVQ